MCTALSDHKQLVVVVVVVVVLVVAPVGMLVAADRSLIFGILSESEVLSGPFAESQSLSPCWCEASMSGRFEYCIILHKVMVDGLRTGIAVRESSESE